jgi:benzoylformate decarboxylase
MRDVRPPARPPAPRAEPTWPISVAYLVQTLADVRDPNDIIVEEAPSSRPIIQSYLPITRSEGFYTMDSGGLGYAMPAAVGVALAKPGQRVIGLIGDGSAMYSIQALWTAAQLRLPMTYVIVNNRRYAALQDFAPVFGFTANEAVQGTDLPDIDFVSIARGMGLAAERVTDPGHLADALRRALWSNAVTLVEVVVA